MDVARPNLPRKRMRRALSGAATISLILLITLGLSRLRPAVPTVERATVWVDTVKRGPMVRQVRGLGALAAEDTRWIPATTLGRVERIIVQPGTTVDPTTVILELSNPTLDQELQEAELKLAASEASLANLRVLLDNDALQQQASAAAIEADYKRAAMLVDVNERLAAEQLIAGLTLKQSKLDAEQLAVRYQIATKQLERNAEAIHARLAVQQSEVDQARAVLRLKQRQVHELRVRSGVAGVLQLVPVDVGQQVAPGTNLARVANPSHLKAELKIAETQAKDIQIGQVASIDTRNGVVDGRVVRVDPSVQNGTVTVDVRMTGPLPKGARPELSVDGTIELERLPDVLFMGRPAFGQEHSTIGVFRLEPGGSATRARVRLGRSSVDTVEVLSGLNLGDQVILSDTSTWDEFDQIHLH